MPIFLKTGLPGEGKTLNTIDELYSFDQKQKKDVIEDDQNKVRPIYHYNIKGLSDVLAWNQLDEEQVKDWNSLPIGSIIIIDECQKIFPILKQGAEKPSYYTLLAEHRHRGYDIYLITQAGTLIDKFVRDLVGYHSYIERKYNSSLTTIWTHKRYISEAQIKKAQGTDSKPYKHNPKIFDLYKSSEEHTIKTKIPTKFKYLFPALLVLIGVIYFIFGDIKDGFTSGSEDKLQEAIAPGSKAEFVNSFETEIEPDILRDGVLKGRTIYITAYMIDQYYFSVDEVLLTERDLARLDYKVFVANICLGMVNKTAVTCPPADYYEYEEERVNTDGLNSREDRSGGEGRRRRPTSARDERNAKT